MKVNHNRLKYIKFTKNIKCNRFNTQQLLKDNNHSINNVKIDSLT
jgi:hypothetical protein